MADQNVEEFGRAESMTPTQISGSMEHPTKLSQGQMPEGKVKRSKKRTDKESKSKQPQKQKEGVSKGKPVVQRLVEQMMSGKKISNVSEYASETSQSMIEPTIDAFNQLVARNTHSLLGRTGIKVSKVCLGTMNFGKIDEKFGERPGQLDEKESHAILDRFLDLGGNCIDTANFYPWFGNEGLSETIIGNWLKNIDRERVFLITKIRLPTDIHNINSGGLSRGNIFNAVCQSLKRLQTDYVDLLLLDGWDSTVNIRETVRDLDDLVKSERIRYFGVCDFKGWQLQKLIDCSKILNLHECVCYSGEYNLLTRGVEWEVAEICRNERIGFFAYSPLKYGLLTDEYTAQSEKPVEGSRIEAASRDKPNLAAMAVSFDEIKQNPIFSNVLNVCQAITNKKNLTTEQIALLWCLQKDFVTSCTLSVKDIHELEECMSVLSHEICLTNKDMCRLTDASNMRLHYPYNPSVVQLAGHRLLTPELTSAFEQFSLVDAPILSEESSTSTEYSTDEESYQGGMTKKYQCQHSPTKVMEQQKHGMETGEGEQQQTKLKTGSPTKRSPERQPIHQEAH